MIIPILITIAVTVLVTLLLVILAVNLLSHEENLDHDIEPLYHVGDDAFQRSIEGVLPPPMVPGNRIDTLVGGDAIFSTMLEAIRSASRTITFENYVYWSGRAGREVAEALADRARAGVRVHVVLDWVGSKAMDQQSLHLMEQAGADVKRYHPPRPRLLARFNQRLHRKILVVDGCVGFTGGAGIADEWWGGAAGKPERRDTHYRITGPVVRELQTSFLDNWLKTDPTVLHGDGYFPPLEHTGPCIAQIFRGTPAAGTSDVKLVYLMSLAAARQSVRLATAYFVPDGRSIRAFIDARRRGIEIDIIVPNSRIDYPVVRRASRGTWGPLLEAGVRIHEYQEAMYHTKMLVIDDQWASVGSTNFDYRSFRLNDETNLNVLDPTFARDQISVFEQDLAASRRITLDQWRSRPLTDKAVEHAASLLRWQL